MKALFDDRFQKVPDPPGTYAPKVRVHHDAGIRIEMAGYLEHGPDGGAFTRNSPVYGDELLLEGVEIGAVCNFPRIVHGTAVGHHDQGFFFGEMGMEPRAHLLDNVS